MTQLNTAPLIVPPTEAPAFEMPPSVVMLEWFSNFWITQAIYSVATLGIADHLTEQPKTAEELAKLTSSYAPALYRVMRALASVGIFAEDENRRFSLTPLAATLQSNVPDSLRSLAMTELGPGQYQSWGNLLHSIKTGEIAFNKVHGMGIWDYYAQNPDEGKAFNQAMNTFTSKELDAIVSSYDFSTFNTVVDVGGGKGSLVTTILNANPTVKGILFDLPHVIEDAQPCLQAAGVSDRCKAIAGQFFESVPAGGDIYLLKNILHDWEDDNALTILQRCHEAMPASSKLLLIEALIPSGNEPSFTKLLDLNMLVIQGGRERTEAEYNALLQATGFRLARIIPTPCPCSVIEAVKA